MAVNYFCSGFDINNAFWPELANKFKSEMKDTKSVVYIPGGPSKIEKSLTKYVPAFTEHFKKAGIIFDSITLIRPDMSVDCAKSLVDNASFIILMGGNPFEQKEMCEKLDILANLKNHSGVLLGFSAGAMLMSEHIIVTPCSDEYPEFRVEDGLNLAGISIYPHNNFDGMEYPEKLLVGDEIYHKKDLIAVAEKYGDFYLLQDYYNANGLTDVSLIRTSENEIELLTYNNGKIFLATKTGIYLVTEEKKYVRR